MMQSNAPPLKKGRGTAPHPLFGYFSLGFRFTLSEIKKGNRGKPSYYIYLVLNAKQQI